MIAISTETASPLMQQWQTCKQAAGEALLLFRLGDFYEAFYEDAKTLSQALDLVLTQRQGVPMAGVPHHQCDSYTDKLIAKGFRVAIAEQTEDAKQAKGLVKRAVTRIVTPGTLINSGLLQEKEHNFFVALAQVGSVYGVAHIDLTTATFCTTEIEREVDLLNELYRLRPAEILVSKRLHTQQAALLEECKKNFPYLLDIEEEGLFGYDTANGFLKNHFQLHSLDGFGLKGMPAAVSAAGALLAYLQEKLTLPVAHIRTLTLAMQAEFVSIDRATQRNLELTQNLQDGSRRHTLLAVLDKTVTPMGGRMLMQWVKQPLKSVTAIRQRQAAVQLFLSHSADGTALRTHLTQIKDLERLVMRIATGYATPRDLIAIRESLQVFPAIQTTLTPHTLFHEEPQLLGQFGSLMTLLTQALVDTPPLRIGDGPLIRENFQAELDELRAIQRDSRAWIATYQQELRERLNCKTLKVGYNRVFGYYIEVSHGQSDKMPASFLRRQTLTNAERFISPELKAYEDKVLSAEEKILSVEQKIFAELLRAVSEQSEALLNAARFLAKIDSLLALAQAAYEYHYTCPEVHEGAELHITEGRHPVIEAALLSERFVPNDLTLDDQNCRLLLITGPNMAGKSTYIRQAALITLMAQMGAFVPATAAKIGVIDKLFTRIGASDDLSRGQSTFMVEMTETANILHNATSRSLVILDEIGRGTSTYDGISIAWAVAEQLLTHPERRPKTLFATHYWELTQLEKQVPGAVNATVAVKEWQEGIIFLRKIIKGACDKSYGIHVAQLAGLPSTVIARANEILQHLEQTATRDNAFAPTPIKPKPKKQPPQAHVDQLALFERN